VTYWKARSKKNIYIKTLGNAYWSDKKKFASLKFLLKGFNILFEVCEHMHNYRKTLAMT